MADKGVQATLSRAADACRWAAGICDRSLADPLIVNSPDPRWERAPEP
jgi:hypothetical protein